MLLELSVEYEGATVEALPHRDQGYDIVVRCKNHACRGWNGIRFRRKKLAA